MVWLTQEIYWRGLFDKPQVLSRAQQCPTRVYPFLLSQKQGLRLLKHFLRYTTSSVAWQDMAMMDFS
jgi:hypothetical protein